MFALKMLMEKYREGQRQLHCVFVDLDKAYDRVPREELWYCMRKSGMAQKIYATCTGYVRASETVVRCAVGTTESFKVKVGLWTMLFADDVVICEESKEEVERRLDCWSLERREIKVSSSKTKYLCINGGNDDKTVKMKDKKSAKSKRI